MADSTLVRLGSIAERRWGLVTTAQAEDAGVSRKQLSRMASAGAIERVAQGVYRMAGAPPQNHEAIYATWLALGGATAPRTSTGVASIVAAGITAAIVHDIGDFSLDGFDFMVPARKGTRLPGVRLRIRQLTRDDVIPVDGLPTLTVERTIADLAELGTDLSLVAGAVRDAVRADKLVAPDRLASYLGPIAARRRSDGNSLANDLFELAGVSPHLAHARFRVHDGKVRAVTATGPPRPPREPPCSPTSRTAPKATTPPNSPRPGDHDLQRPEPDPRWVGHHRLKGWPARSCSATSA